MIQKVTQKLNPETVLLGEEFDSDYSEDESDVILITTPLRPMIP